MICIVDRTAKGAKLPWEAMAGNQPKRFDHNLYSVLHYSLSSVYLVFHNAGESC